MSFCNDAEYRSTGPVQDVILYGDDEYTGYPTSEHSSSDDENDENVPPNRQRRSRRRRRQRSREYEYPAGGFPDNEMTKVEDCTNCFDGPDGPVGPQPDIKYYIQYNKHIRHIVDCDCPTLRRARELLNGETYWNLTPTQYADLKEFYGIIVEMYPLKYHTRDLRIQRLIWDANDVRSANSLEVKLREDFHQMIEFLDTVTKVEIEVSDPVYAADCLMKTSYFCRIVKALTINKDIDMANYPSYNHCLHFENLENLSLVYSEISDRVVIGILRLTYSLKHLSIVGCNRINGSIAGDTHNNFNNLEVLKITHCLQFSNESLAKIISASPNLIELQIQNSNSLGIQLCSVIFSCYKLVKLDLTFPACESIDKLVMIRNLPDLENFTLSLHQTQASESDRPLPFQKDNMVTLKSLNYTIARPHEVSFDLIKILMEAAPNLSDLVITCDSRIENLEILLAPLKRPNLKKYELVVCREIQLGEARPTPDTEILKYIVCSASVDVDMQYIGGNEPEVLLKYKFLFKRNSTIKVTNRDLEEIVNFANERWGAIQ